MLVPTSTLLFWCSVWPVQALQATDNSDNRSDDDPDNTRVAASTCVPNPIAGKQSLMLSCRRDTAWRRRWSKLHTVGLSGVLGR